MSNFFIQNMEEAKKSEIGGWVCFCIGICMLFFLIIKNEKLKKILNEDLLYTYLYLSTTLIGLGLVFGAIGTSYKNKFENNE